MDRLEQSRKIDSHAHSTLLSETDISSSLLEKAIENSIKNKLPPITISPLQGQYLAIQARLMNAKSILEIGTLGGYSTLWFASTGAHVTSIEINPRHRDVALENTKYYVDKGKVEIILGEALKVLSQLLKEKKQYDFIFIDAAWEEQWEYFFESLKIIKKPGGVIYVDNVVRALLEDGDDKLDYLKKEETLLSKVGKLGKDVVEATLISTISSHKSNEEDMVDGFLLAIVK